MKGSVSDGQDEKIERRILFTGLGINSGVYVTEIFRPWLILSCVGEISIVEF